MGTKEGAREENLLNAIRAAGASHTELNRLRAEVERLTEALAEAEKDAADNLVELTRLRVEVERLQKALLWIDNHDPEIVAAAETKFGFKLAAFAPAWK